MVIFGIWPTSPVQPDTGIYRPSRQLTSEPPCLLTCPCLQLKCLHRHLGGVSPEAFESASLRGWKTSTEAGAIHWASHVLSSYGPVSGSDSGRKEKSRSTTLCFFSRIDPISYRSVGDLMPTGGTESDMSATQRLPAFPYWKPVNPVIQPDWRFKKWRYQPSINPCLIRPLIRRPPKPRPRSRTLSPPRVMGKKAHVSHSTRAATNLANCLPTKSLPSTEKVGAGRRVKVDRHRRLGPSAKSRKK